MILGASDLQQLTGYTRYSYQVRWLRRHGWRFTVNALGEPVVARAEFNRRMVGGRSTTTEPNWEAMGGAGAQA